jgi:hypothetical protein
VHPWARILTIVAALKRPRENRAKSVIAMGGATGGVRLRVRSCLWLVSAILIRSSRTINNLRDARAPADESPRQLHGGCLAPHLSWITGTADTPTSSDFCPGHAEQRWATTFAESSLCREHRTTIREYCSAALEATFGQNGLSAPSRMLLTGRHERFCANLPYGRSKSVRRPSSWRARKWRAPSGGSCPSGAFAPIAWCASKAHRRPEIEPLGQHDRPAAG